LHSRILININIMNNKDFFIFVHPMQRIVKKLLKALSASSAASRKLKGLLYFVS
jgi:hypothetical protein